MTHPEEEVEEDIAVAHCDLPPFGDIFDDQGVKSDGDSSVNRHQTGG